MPGEHPFLDGALMDNYRWSIELDPANRYSKRLLEEAGSTVP